MANVGGRKMKEGVKRKGYREGRQEELLTEKKGRSENRLPSRSLLRLAPTKQREVEESILSEVSGAPPSPSLPPVNKVQHHISHDGGRQKNKRKLIKSKLDGGRNSLVVRV